MYIQMHMHIHIFKETTAAYSSKLFNFLLCGQKYYLELGLLEKYDSQYPPEKIW